METIRCPICGSSNPGTLERCKACNQILRQSTTELDGRAERISSGQTPTEKKTSELEAALPAWLRHARQRDEEEEQTASASDPEEIQAQDQKPEEVPIPPDFSEEVEEESNAVSDPLDWLAGLDSEEDEEEAADWLVNLQGDLASEEEIKEEPHADRPAADEPITANIPPASTDEEEASVQTGELPGWISDLQGGETEDSSSLPDLLVQEEAAPVSDTDEGGLPDWLSRLSEEAETPAASIETSPAQPVSVSTTDAEPLAAEASDALPDWMADLQPIGETTEAPPSSVESKPEVKPTEADDALPDWMADLQPVGEETPAEEAAESAIASDELPDWLSDEEKPPAVESVPEESQPAEVAEDLPDWMTNLQAAEEDPTLAAEATEDDDLPDWLNTIPAEDFSGQGSDKTVDLPPQENIEEELASPQALETLSTELTRDADEDPTLAAAEAEVPDWLSRMEKPATGPLSEITPAATETETPDWIASLPAEDETEKENSAEVETSASSPAFVADGSFVDGDASDDSDEIFGIEMPDWLSSLAPSDAEKVEKEPDAAQAGAPEDLSGAELPSWVQAMRPVASVVSDSSKSKDGEEHVVASTGPLAGLSGILPVGPGMGTKNKPRAHAIKLRVTDSQQSSAAILENLLASESESSFSQKADKTTSLPLLRWGIALLLFLAIGYSLFTQTKMAPSPNIAVPEVGAAIQEINQLPEAGSALLIFDYEAALSAEMQVAAAPLIDHLMLRGEKIAVLSTSPTGPALAERFLQETQSSHAYQQGIDYVNLGYLPGGASGMLSFISSPQNAIAAQLNGASVWDLAPLANITNLTDFSVVIVLTDDVERGRSWIEQASATLNASATPFLMAISAQAEPIIYPYFASGQVDGLVSGLSGGATYERLQGQSGVGRKYWDAYSIGLLLAEILIVVGATINLLASLRARQKTDEDEG
ncbi:MAG: hypothetical protein HN855_00825 [Anaerolineae bacterium]|jgi:hypothetical protein|nr:hypothetical protein [Anaerolineae bacterium]MBT7070802.1 hypothetical protein [Anaerolineae bacterium]MBT7323684.1 hypothetical protein [Anaerolineae bacterium]